MKAAILAIVMVLLGLTSAFAIHPTPTPPPIPPRAVPEPATLMLLGVGLVALIGAGVIKRRKK